MAKTDKRPSEVEKEGQMEAGELMQATEESTEADLKREEGDEQEPENNAVDEKDENTPIVTKTKKKKRKSGGKRDGGKVNSSGSEGKVVKRKAEAATEISPSKKTKLINDGFCLFVGNLNTSKTSDEIKNSLANYLIKQSLLFEDVRLDRTRKHAFVDLASEIDLTKALTLDGQELLDKPMKIAKAKVKCVAEEEQEKKKKKTPLDKKVRDGRSLFLKNLPYDATKDDILKLFRKAVAVRFPGGTKAPSKGIAFVKFQNTKVVKKILEKKRKPKIQGRVLIVGSVGQSNEVTAKADGNGTKVSAPPSNALFVNNLAFNVKDQQLKRVFKKAVSISVPRSQGRARGYAFVEFATVEEAEKAFQLVRNIKICNRTARVEFCDLRGNPDKGKEPSETLIVVGLAEKTTAETLQKAFEGALSARVAQKPDFGVPKRFGFVEFDSEESCRAVREAMEDCEIDGMKVTVAYAKPRGEGRRPAVKCPRGQSSGAAVHKGKRGQKGKGKTRGSGVPPDASKEVKSRKEVAVE